MALARLGMICLDCEDPAGLAAFWARLLGAEVTPVNDDVVVVGNKGTPVAALRVAGYQPPTWPNGEIPKQIHLDLAVDDLDAYESEAIMLWARRADEQPRPGRWRVMLDPAGHPFCLCDWTKELLPRFARGISGARRNWPGWRRGSPDFLARHLLEMGFDEVMASRFPALPFRGPLDPGGILTPGDKVRIVDELRARHGLPGSRCVAYGDSMSDAPLFRRLARRAGRGQLPQRRPGRRVRARPRSPRWPKPG